MANKAYTREEVLSVLRDGGELWYFRVEGGVAIHDKKGEPVQGCYCPIEIFLSLRTEGVITMTHRDRMGYPFYANNHRSSTYRLA